MTLEEAGTIDHSREKQGTRQKHVQACACFARCKHDGMLSDVQCQVRSKQHTQVQGQTNVCRQSLTGDKRLSSALEPKWPRCAPVSRSIYTVGIALPASLAVSECDRLGSHSA